MQQVLRSGKPALGEDVPLELRRGGARETAYFTFSLGTLRDEAGTVTGVCATVLETTAKVQAVAAQHESEARLALIFERALVGLSEIAPDGRFVQANAELGRILGRSPDALRQVTIADVTYPDDVAPSLLATSQVLEKGGSATLEERYQRPDGTLVMAQSSLTRLDPMDGGEPRLLAVTVDLTARRQAQEALRESEARIRAIANLVPDLLWSDDARGHTDWVNRRWLDYTGLSEEEILGGGWCSTIHSEDLPRVLSHRSKAMQQEHAWESEHRIRRFDGDFRWHLVRAEPLRDPDGRVVRWFGSATDIHEQRLSRELLEQRVTERTHALRQLLLRVETVQDDERRRIARELHDSLGQYLASLLLAVSGLKGEVTDPLARERLDALEGQLQRVDRELDRLVFILRPTALEDCGLGEGVEAYVQTWSQLTGVAVYRSRSATATVRKVRAGGRGTEHDKRFRDWPVAGGTDRSCPWGPGRCRGGRRRRHDLSRQPARVCNLNSSNAGSRTMTSNHSPSVPGLPRVPTGISGLDEVIGGGFLKSGVYMVQGAPGAGKTILANQISYILAAAGARVVYVTMLAESHARMLQHMSAFSFFDEKLVPEHVYYVSAFNALRDGGLPAVVNLLRAEMRTHKAQLLVFDGLVIAANAAASDESLKLFISDIQVHSTLTGCTTLLLASDDADRTVTPEQTMVDGILLLRECALGPRRERRLDVVKFRGSNTLRGTHAFRIGATGITVYPRLESARRESPAAAIRPRGVSTGIDGLDRMFEIGGLPEGSVTAVSGYSGSGKTSIGLHFLARASAQEPGLFFGFYESPEFLLQISQSLGFDLQPLVDAGVLHFVWQPFGENLLDELAARLLESIRRTGARRVVIDSLGGFAAATAYEARDGGFLASLANELRRSGATSLITVEDTDAERSSLPISTPTMSALSDNIIRLAVQVERSVRHSMWIGKVRNSRCDLRVRNLVLASKGLEIVDAATPAGATTTTGRTDE